MRQTPRERKIQSKREAERERERERDITRTTFEFPLKRRSTRADTHA